MARDGVIGRVVSEHIMVGLTRSSQGYNPFPRKQPPSSNSSHGTLATVTRHPCPQHCKGLHHPAIR